MRISLRDNQTGKNVDVEATGASFGRDAARCHVVIADKSVSNLHAKVFAKDGRWFVEDQGSSNGTYVGGKRSSGPVEIKPGDEIAFFRYGYKVLGSAEGGETALFVKDSAGPEPELARPAGAARAPEPTRRRTPDLDGGDDDEPALAGQAALMAAFKRGLSYYVAAVPKLGLKPMPTAKEGVEAQAFGAMQKLELAAFAAPALVFGALVAAVCGGLATMLRGAIVAGLVAMVTSALVGTAVNLVAALIAGFILHPVLAWLINILRGHSDAASRTNYAVALFAAGALTQILSGVGVVVAALPVPFISIVPLLLGLYGAVVALYVSYLWLQYFAVMRWVPIVMLAFMGLAGLGTLSGIYGVVRYDIGVMRGGTAVADAATPVPVPEAAVASAAAGESRPSLIDRVKGWFGKGAPAPAPTTAAVVEQPAGGATPQPGAAPGSTTGADGSPAPAPGGAMPAPGNATPAPAEPERTPYAEYQRKRDAVEKAVAADPTLLTRAVGVKPLYRKLHEELAKFKKVKTKGGEPYEDRLRQAEVYEATVTLVDDLYTKAVEKPVFAAAVPAPEGKAVKKKTGKGKSGSSKSKAGSTH